MAKAKILVTGGLGYIGSHTVVELVQAGYEPIILDNLSNSTISVLDALEKIIGFKPVFGRVEMCDKSELEAFVAKHKPQAVIHFAALLQVKESVLEPLKYYHNNLLSTIHLMDVMEQHKIRPLVFSSSCTVYGNPDTLPVREDAPVKPAVSPYGATKQMCEDIIRDVTSATELKAILLRYFNPIGAHESALIGEVQHGEPHHLVPYITETAKGKRQLLKIFGGDYQTRDGTCVRDYIHVSDIARAHVNAVDRLLLGQNDEACEIFNLGSGTGQTVLEMVHAFEAVTGLKVPHEIAPRREGDVEATYADISKAEELLNWKPEFPLEEMLRSAWKWEMVQS
jgi:UDP-glucose 4-epimerase